MRDTDRMVAGRPSEQTLLEALCNNASGAMFILDQRQHCIYMNPAARQLTGFDLEEVRGRPLHDLIHHTRPDGRPYPIEECPIDRAFPENNRERGRDVFVHKDGDFYRVEYTASPVREEGAVVGTVLEVRDIRAEIEAVEALEEERHTLETINRTGAMLAAKLDLEELVQAVTDAATDLSGARFGAFFYNTIREGRALQLYTLSGAPREAFSAFPPPQHTAIFGPTFSEGSVLRIDDIRRDPRYGRAAPFYGMPPGHLPVTSYLAAPVIGRGGEIMGALIFGHEKPGIFTERAERIVTAIAAQAAIAIDNSALFDAAQSEILERQKFEEHQEFLIQELNHRVKNMLATVQSIATQTLRGRAEDEAMETFQGRLLALSKSHSLIMRENWREVDLRDVAATALAPFLDAHAAGDRARLTGPPVRLSPKVALSLGMGFHELATNAAKYGALGAEAGVVEIRWRNVDADEICITWVEKNGPSVKPPRRKGFGSRLLERGLAHELGGTVKLVHDPGGLICEIRMPVPEGAPGGDGT
ncbi:HWE histidine kinase domain-containing protein [Citreimonas salinaria]|uniref:histidine kinase n=1 Tax=Citreimonas salinaria TaxID=321339 RepID=A0A1H3GWQ9_9RHOB|nr:HWE histidine kinase domain-containing protein [Citreimonas salinaria]SDY06789.1 PAS domain S-box-containing protein [Citreimonas salinaria]